VNSFNKNIKQVVYQANSFVDSDEALSIDKSILINNEGFDLVSDLKDEYFYLFHRNIISILNEERVKKFQLIRSELIPFLINHIHHSKMQNYNPRNKCINQNKDNKKDDDGMIIKHEKEKDFKVRNKYVFYTGIVISSWIT